MHTSVSIFPCSLTQPSNPDASATSWPSARHAVLCCTVLYPAISGDVLIQPPPPSFPQNRSTRILPFIVELNRETLYDFTIPILYYSARAQGGGVCIPRYLVRREEGVMLNPPPPGAHRCDGGRVGTCHVLIIAVSEAGAGAVSHGMLCYALGCGEGLGSWAVSCTVDRRCGVCSLEGLEEG